jgi:broad specificity phosphatase PhoE
VTRIVLTRHGHVQGIDPPRFRGRADIPLTELGVRQAGATALCIHSRWQPVAVYSSPLFRCMTTAGIIADACQIVVEPRDELNDLDYGEWQGRLESEIAVEMHVLIARWRTCPQDVRFPGGESLQDLVARTANALRLFTARHPDQTIVAVGHDSVNRALLLQLLDQPLSAYWRIAQSPCGITEIEIRDGRVRVLTVNDHEHVPTR